MADYSQALGPGNPISAANATFGPIMRALLGLAPVSGQGGGQTPDMALGSIAGGLPMPQNPSLTGVAQGLGNIAGAYGQALQGSVSPQAKRLYAGAGTGASVGTLLGGPAGTIAGTLIGSALSSPDLSNAYDAGVQQTAPNYGAPAAQPAPVVGQLPPTAPAPKPKVKTGGASAAPPVQGQIPDALGGVGVPQGPMNNPDPLAEYRSRIDASMAKIEKLASERDTISPEEQRVRVLAALAGGAAQGLQQGGRIANVLGSAGALGLGEVANIKAEQRKMADDISNKLIAVEGMKIKNEGNLATLETAIARTAIMEKRLGLAQQSLNISGEVAKAKIAELQTSQGKNAAIEMHNRLENMLLLYKNQPNMNINVPSLVGVKALGDLPPSKQILPTLAWDQINDPTSELAKAAHAQILNDPQNKQDIALARQTKGPAEAEKYERGLWFAKLMELNAQRFAAGDQSIVTELARVRSEQYDNSPFAGLLRGGQ
jgi:hypothetical protein